MSAPRSLSPRTWPIWRLLTPYVVTSMTGGALYVGGLVAAAGLDGDAADLLRGLSIGVFLTTGVARERFRA